MKSFDQILSDSDILEEDKKFFMKVLASQNQLLIDKIKSIVEYNPEALNLFIDLIKLKIIGKSEINKEYLRIFLGKEMEKVTQVI